MNAKEELAQEYSKYFDSWLLWILKFTGFFRFTTKNGRLIRKNATTTLLRCFFAVLSGNASVYYMCHVNYWIRKLMIIPEVIILALFAVLQNSISINIAFPNRNSGLTLLNYCIKIDLLLGIKATKFMRDVAVRAFLFFVFIIAFSQTVILTVLYFAYFTTVLTQVVGTVYFTLVFCIFYDVCSLLTFYVFLALRVHYLNLAIIKKAGINAGYFPEQFLFDGLLWKKKFDDLVTFNEFASTEHFVEAFKIIFKIVRHVEKCYRFTVFIGTMGIITGTFLVVQMIITYEKYTNFNTLRIVATFGWVFLGWVYVYIVSQQTDLFCRQINKTKLICTYIQLKPTCSDESLKLTRSVIRTLRVREPRLSIYGMFFYNTGLVLRIASSIFIYITVQLQIMIPVSEESNPEPTAPAHRDIFFFR